MKVRVAVTTHRPILLGVVLAFGIAACAANDDSSSTPTNDAPVTIVASTTTSTTTTSTTTTTTTLAPTTTIAPAVEVVNTVCASLRTDGLETRRVMVNALAESFTAAGGDGDGRAEVAAECGEQLDRLDGAVAIRDRMQTIDMAEEDDLFAMSFTGFSCADGTFQITVTNDAEIPLGLHANFAVYLNGEKEDAVESSLTPIVVWSIAPGATEVVTGRFIDFTGPQVSCNFEAQVFDADPSSAGAAVGAEPEYPALTGDNPAVWFPALSDVEDAARTSGDIDLAAATEDVRSMAYDEVALAISEGDVLPEIEMLEVCERGRSQPDADHIGFVYLSRLPNGTDDGRFAPGDSRLSHGLFRRGADGQWRWLSTARYYESSIGVGCRSVDPEF